MCVHNFFININFSVICRRIEISDNFSIHIYYIYSFSFEKLARESRDVTSSLIYKCSLLFLVCKVNKSFLFYIFFRFSFSRCFSYIFACFFLGAFFSSCFLVCFSSFFFGLFSSKIFLVSRMWALAWRPTSWDNFRYFFSPACGGDKREGMPQD